MSLQRGRSSADLSQYVDWSALESQDSSQPVSQDWSHVLRAPPAAEEGLETQQYPTPAEDDLETQRYSAPAEDDLETQKYQLETPKYNFQKVLETWQTKYWSRRCKNDQTGANAVLKKDVKKSWKNGTLKEVLKKGAEQEQTGAHVE